MDPEHDLRDFLKLVCSSIFGCEWDPVCRKRGPSFGGSYDVLKFTDPKHNYIGRIDKLFNTYDPDYIIADELITEAIEYNHIPENSYHPRYEGYIGRHLTKTLLGLVIGNVHYMHANHPKPIFSYFYRKIKSLLAQDPDSKFIKTYIETVKLFLNYDGTTRVCGTVVALAPHRVPEVSSGFHTIGILTGIMHHPSDEEIREIKCVCRFVRYQELLQYYAEDIPIIQKDQEKIESVEPDPDPEPDSESESGSDRIEIQINNPFTLSLCTLEVFSKIHIPSRTLQNCILSSSLE